MVDVAVGDWVPCLNYGEQTTLDIQVPTILSFDEVLVGVGPAEIGSLGDVATVEVEDEVLAKRVVGWVLFRTATVADHTVLVHERIRVGLRDDQGVMSFFATDFQVDTEANEPFLWERVAILDIPAGIAVNYPEATVGHPGWSSIDVRVARRLRRQDVLVYSIKVTSLTAAPFAVEDVFSFIPHLRTWARSLG